MTSACALQNDYNGGLGVRISSIFVIFVGSALGSVFPVVVKRLQEGKQGKEVKEGREIQKGKKCKTGLDWSFFVAKYFGSGVIVATAFIHLLAPANEALGNECLSGVITAYPWPEGIALIAVFLIFFVEIAAMRFAKFGHDHTHDHGNVQEHDLEPGTDMALEMTAQNTKYHDESNACELSSGQQTPQPATGCSSNHHIPGEDHFSHMRDHPHSPTRGHAKNFDPESYAAQMTALSILEFGVIFHSIFIGFTLAVSGAEFKTLYPVLVFHQTFEGLGLGTRLASTNWPESKKITAYFMALGYAFSTPIAIAIGLGLRTTLNPGSQTALIANGIFDSVSAGILMYTGLVELMAHEFMFSSNMQEAPFGEVLSAFGFMVLGAFVMALLGKWA